MCDSREFEIGRESESARLAAGEESVQQGAPKARSDAAAGKVVFGSV